MALVLPLAVGAVLLPTTAAEAAVGGDYTANGVYIRTGPHVSSPAVGEGYPGQGANVYCYTYGDDIGGDYRWVLNQDRATGKTGYSSAHYMRWSGFIPQCNT